MGVQSWRSKRGDLPVCNCRQFNAIIWDFQLCPHSYQTQGLSYDTAFLPPLDLHLWMPINMWDHITRPCLIAKSKFPLNFEFKFSHPFGGNPKISPLFTLPRPIFWKSASWTSVLTATVRGPTEEFQKKLRSNPYSASDLEFSAEKLQLRNKAAMPPTHNGQNGCFCPTRGAFQQYVGGHRRFMAEP